MEKEDYPKIKNALVQLAYLLSQTTRSELGEATIDTLKFYRKDNPQFLNESLAVLNQICQHKNLLPRQTYLLAMATREQVKHNIR